MKMLLGTRFFQLWTNWRNSMTFLWSSVSSYKKNHSPHFLKCVFLLSEDCFPKLLIALCKELPKDSLANQQALAKQLADVLDFVLRFDDAKVRISCFVFQQTSAQLTRFFLDGESCHSKWLFLLPTNSEPHEVVQKGHESYHSWWARKQDVLVLCLSHSDDECPEWNYGKIPQWGKLSIYIPLGAHARVLMHLCRTQNKEYPKKMSPMPWPQWLMSVSTW